MIKAKNDNVKLKGNAPELLTEYTLITKSLIDAIMNSEGDENFAREVVAEAYRHGTMPEEEVKKEIEKKVAMILSDIVSKLNEGRKVDE